MFLDSADDNVSAYALARRYAHIATTQPEFRGVLISVRRMSTRRGRTWGIFAVRNNRQPNYGPASRSQVERRA